MSSSFKNLKKSSGSFDKLHKAIETLQSGNNYEAENAKYWKPDIDKAGNGSAVIRFLAPPEADGEDALPWVKYFAHGFKGQGGWLIDNCPTTHGEQCPVCDANSELWNTGNEDKKKLASSRKRKLNYVSNVYIVSDPKHPENNGTVKLFRYGTKIHDKILSAASPSFEDEKPVDAFDMWQGANFKLRVQTVDKFPNYDASKFDTPSPLAKSDDEIEKIWQQCHSLKAVVDPSNFKSYEDLKKRLDKVLGTNSGAPKTVEQAKAAVRRVVEEDNITEEDIPAWDTPASKKNETEEDGFDFFNKLAEAE